MADFLRKVRAGVKPIGRFLPLLECHASHTTVLHIVAMRNNVPALFLFLKEAHALTPTSTDDATFARCAESLNHQDLYGNTPLHYLALRSAFPEEATVLQMRMETMRGFGADFQIGNKAGETVYDVLASGTLTCSSDPERGGVRYHAATDTITHLAIVPDTATPLRCSVL